MADIEAERAWLRGHAVQQRVEDEATQRKRWAAELERAAQTCRYCFHDRHEIHYASGSWSGRPDEPWTIEAAGPPVVLYCRADGCVCGVSPCGDCGSRERVPDAVTRRKGLEIPVERCAGCGREWDMAAYA